MSKFIAICFMFFLGAYAGYHAKTDEPCYVLPPEGASVSVTTLEATP